MHFWAQENFEKNFGELSTIVVSQQRATNEEDTSLAICILKTRKRTRGLPRGRSRVLLNEL